MVMWLKEILNHNNLWKAIQAVGTLLIGIGAVIALPNTGDALKEVLQIQEQAKQIQTTLNRLESFLKKEIAFSAYSRKKQGETPEQAIGHIPLSNMNLKSGEVFLPFAKRAGIVELFSNENIPASEKIRTLENSLEIKD